MSRPAECGALAVGRIAASGAAGGCFGRRAKLTDNFGDLRLPGAAASASAAPTGSAALAPEHLALLFRRQRLDLRPPFDGFLIHFTGARAQQQEVVSGAEAFVLQQTPGTRALVLRETPLHREQLLHRRTEAARKRRLLARDNALARLEHRLTAVPPLAFELLGERLDREPEEHRVQKSRRNRLVLADPNVGVLETAADKARDLLCIRRLEHRLRVAE